MAEKNKNPEVRFAGFTDDWEQHELGEVLTERKILQKISDDAPILAFASGQGVIDRSERKSNNRDHLTLDPTNKIYKLTEYNDIVYNPSNLKYGAIDRNKHGRGVISPIYVTFTTEDEPSFIELIVKSEKFKLRALQYEEGTVVKRQSVKPENLLTLDVKISPSLDEQKKIGELFEHLGIIISLHQCKYDNLINVKKAILEKLFPKNGADVPEIRFKGFTGAWELQEMGDIADFSRGKALSRNDIVSNGNHECVLYGQLYSDYGMVINNVKYSTNKYSDKFVFSRFGDVLIPSSDTTPTGLARATSIEKSGVILGGDINILSPKPPLVGSFLSYNINSNRNKLIKLIKGTTVKHLVNSDLENIEIFIPKNPNEQEKISETLKSFDHLINLHQYELERLKNIKKACLEKMFV